MHHHPWLILLGVALGTLGTLIGAGGGFVLVPVLILLYPVSGPETITSISLAVVFFNALSGSWAYARLGRIDYRSGLLFAAATIPGAIAGALTTNLIPRRAFNAVLGVLLAAMAVYLLRQRSDGPVASVPPPASHTTRSITDRSGEVFTYAYDSRLGMGLSLVVGYLSSLLGIGGGIIHVPALARWLNFPVHIATATSHFILAIMALTGTVVHVATGSFAHGGLGRTVSLGIGVLIGAQAGAWLSTRVQGRWILRGLAMALGVVGLRIVLLAWQG